MTEEAVLRLYRAIVERVQDRNTSSVTVGELHEQIVPYAAVRSAIGVELNADYEHALLRLLAGERGLLRVEPESARRELAEEARSPYPTVGLFRKFSDCRVRIRVPDEPWLKPAPAPGADSALDPDADPAPDPDPDLASDPDPDAAPVPDPDLAPASGGEEAPVEDNVAGAAAEAAARARACPFCGAELPTSRPVRYCPGCGADQQSRPCPRCGTALDPTWRFCISCGEDVTA